MTMNDTPRVTVPVEPTEAMIEAGNRALSPWIAPAMHAAEAYRAMLSAAPAPESGAVERACVVFQEAIDDFEAEVADVMADGSERADLWDREITVNIDALKTVMSAALAAREEAPAEAGEWITGDQLHEIMQSFTDRADVSEIAAKINASIALRAQPPAREDAQPVWVDGVPTKHHAKEWFIAETTFGDRVVLTALPEEYNYDFKTADETYIKADRIKRWMPFPDSQYLFPHPAPDALRVAVAKLEKAKITDDPAEVFMLAMEALAALQAEQEGGA